MPRIQPATGLSNHRLSEEEGKLRENNSQVETVENVEGVKVKMEKEINAVKETVKEESSLTESLVKALKKFQAIEKEAKTEIQRLNLQILAEHKVESENDQIKINLDKTQESSITRKRKRNNKKHSTIKFLKLGKLDKFSTFLDKTMSFNDTKKCAKVQTDMVDLGEATPESLALDKRLDELEDKTTKGEESTSSNKKKVMMKDMSYQARVER